ncbi:serine/threonine-protein kinase [archaeon]|nr:MAG: serine/threonine-protein kinase [archaeon]
MGLASSKERFIFDKKAILGGGNGGTVYLGIDNESKAKVAIKVVAKSRLIHNLVDIEVEQGALKLSHPHILHLVHAYEDKNNYYLVTNFCSGGDLEAYVKNQGALPESVAKLFLVDIVKAVWYLSEHNLIHRDIKPSNLLLNDMSIIVGDFGTAKFLDINRMAKTCVGTMYFCAPEVLLAESYDHQADMWSIGVTLYYMLTATLPFDITNEFKYRRAAREGDVIVPENRAQISDELWDIIVKVGSHHTISDNLLDLV